MLHDGIETSLNRCSFFHRVHFNCLFIALLRTGGEFSLNCYKCQEQDFDSNDFSYSIGRPSKLENNYISTS